jgi:hypothetical protein
MKVKDSSIYDFNWREKDVIVKVKKAYEKFKDLAIQSSLIHLFIINLELSFDCRIQLVTLVIYFESCSFFAIEIHVNILIYLGNLIIYHKLMTMNWILWKTTWRI